MSRETSSIKIDSEIKRVLTELKTNMRISTYNDVLLVLIQRSKAYNDLAKSLNAPTVDARDVLNGKA